MAGTVTQGKTREEGKVIIIPFTCVGDATNGSFPSAPIPFPLRGYLINVRTTPGTTNPTASWGYTITDSNGLDVMGGAGTGRSATNPELQIPILNVANSVFGANYVYGNVTLNITGNSVNSAQINLEITVQR